MLNISELEAEYERLVAKSLNELIPQLRRKEDDEHLLLFQLRKVVESIEFELGQKTLASDQVRARLLALRGDLWRYLARFDSGASAYRATSHSYYLKALGLNGADQRAFSGLFVLNTLGQKCHRPLLGVAYLVKLYALNPSDDPVRDVLETWIHRLVSSPSELTDVPIPARTCVAAILEVVSRGIFANPATRKLMEIIAATIPSGESMNGTASTPWDALCVLILITALSIKPSNSVTEIVKLLVGRALSLDRPVTLLAAIDFEPVAPGLRQLRLGNCPVGTSWDEIARTESIELDHLTGSLMRDKVTFCSDAAKADMIARGRIWKQLLDSQQRSSAKRVVIVDAANVACRAGEGSGKAAPWSLRSVYDFYTRMGHEVKIVVSEKHLKRRKNWRSGSGIEIRLDEALTLLPPSSVVLIPPQNHDDSYMIALALRLGGVVVTNDMFRDWVGNRPTEVTKLLADRWARSHLVAFTFMDTLFLPNPDFVMPPDTNEWDALFT